MSNEAFLLPNHRDKNSHVNSVLPVKSRRGRKRVTDPVLAGELRRHRRSRANDRERTRMRSLNEALEHLRTLLPLDAPAYYSSAESCNSGTSMEDKLTKIETLRTASAYIRLLTDLLDDNHSASGSSSHAYEHHEQLYSHTSCLSYPSSFPYYHHCC